jgi:N12 class adenine-specific DNA methylase
VLGSEQDLLKIVRQGGTHHEHAPVCVETAWSSFVRDFGSINHTTVSILEDAETGELKETHRQPNLLPFRDAPDCWLVASIEDNDLGTDTAKPGPIFSERIPDHLIQREL